MVIMQIQPGQHAERDFTVTRTDTAATVGSGSLEVLGTPRLLAWCEAVTCMAIERVLDDGHTSVGTRVSLEHLVPSPVGASVRVRAAVVDLDGRRVRFEVRAAHADGTVIATGEVTRAVVDAARFLAGIG